MPLAHVCSGSPVTERNGFGDQGRRFDAKLRVASLTAFSALRFVPTFVQKHARIMAQVAVDMTVLTAFGSRTMRYAHRP